MILLSRSLIRVPIAAAVCAAVAAVMMAPKPLALADAQEDAPQSQLPVKADTQRDGSKAPGGGQEARRGDGSARQMMARRWRNPSDEDTALFIEVAGQLNPTWRDSLVQLRTDDPEAFRRTISSNGRRLWQLVELRESNPSLYNLRIKEIQTQGQLRELGKAYRLAMEEGETAEAEELHGKIKEMATLQVDLQMRVRGEELAAMADALERLRKDLLDQATERVERAELIVERVMAPRPEGDYAGERSSGGPPGLGQGGRPPRGGLLENGSRPRKGEAPPSDVTPDPPNGL